MNQYCVVSGYDINLNKFGIFFSMGCPENLRRSTANKLRVLGIGKTGKYMGITSDWGTTKKQIFAWVLPKVNMKLE